MIQKANQQKLVFAWGVVLLVVRTTNLWSLFVEWVKLFMDKVTRGGKMKKWMLAICLMFINEICQATDCFDLAGRGYKIDPDIVRYFMGSIAEVHVTRHRYPLVFQAPEEALHRAVIPAISSSTQTLFDLVTPQ